MQKRFFIFTVLIALTIGAQADGEGDDFME